MTNISAGQKLLLVSDQVRNLGPLEACLNPFGYDLVKVPSLESAGALFEQVQPDSIVLDLDLPSVAAIAFIEQVRLHKTPAEAPIIMISPYSEAELRESGWQLGADEFLERPVDSRGLHACIQRLLQTDAESMLGTSPESEQQSRQHGDLFATAARDLETPLNAIRANIQWTCERLGNEQAPLSEALQAALEAADRATAILDELRTLSTLERRMQSTKRHAVPLSKLLTTTLAHYQGFMNMRGIVLEASFENGILVQADAKLLQTVLDRILDGLIRASVRASSLSIRVQQADSVEISLELRALNGKNAGRGLLPNVVRAARAQPGPEIGRHFCERVIAAMAGELRVQDSAHGTLVRIRLPKHVSRGSGFLTAMFPARKAQ